MRSSSGHCVAPTSGAKSRIASTSRAPGSPAASNSVSASPCDRGRARGGADGRAVLALDPVATLAIEDLIQELKAKFTIAIVTHNMQQAAARATIRPSSTSRERRSGPARRAGGDDEDFSNPASRRPRTTSAGGSDDDDAPGLHRRSSTELEERRSAASILSSRRSTGRWRRSTIPTSSSPRW